MKKIILSLLLLLAVSFTATGVFAAPDLSKDESISEYADKKIVFLGDSITAGAGVTLPKDKYTEIVADELGFGSMVNMGKSGTTLAVRSGRTDSIAERAASVPADADYVIVYGGINDWTNNVPIADVTSALSTIKSTLETNTDATIIFLTPFKSFWQSIGAYTVDNSVEANLTDYRNLIVTAADQSEDKTPRVNIIDLYSIIGFDASDEVDRNKFTTDGVHLNILGNKRLANILVSYFRGENLLNDVTYTSEFYAKDGILNAAANVAYTNLIPVIAGKTYVFKSVALDGAPIQQLGQFHAADENYVSNIPLPPRNRFQTFTVPAGVSYVILNTSSDADIQNGLFLRELLNYEVYSITFNSNGGTSVPGQSLEFGQEVLKPENPTKTGFTFAGWFKNENLTTPFDFESQDPLDGDITLYAKWLPSSGGGAPVGGDSASSSTLMYLLIAGAAAAGYYLFFTDKGRKSIGLK